MAVYKRTYQRYSGPLTPGWSRFLIIPRYAFEGIFRSRLLTAFYVGCFIFPLVCAIIIYARHNLSFLSLAGVDPKKIITIDAHFFLSLVGFQGLLSFFLTAFVGPSLVSADLANNALPLYLSRPLSRWEYILGKSSVLAVLISFITWIPGTLLFLLEANLEGGAWFSDNIWVLAAVLLCCWLWIAILCLLALALSAWVKWRLAASALIFGVFFVGAGFGHAINQTLSTRWGNLINLGHLMGTVWAQLFRVRLRATIWGEMFGVRNGSEIPETAAWLMILALAGFCLYLLWRKVRACEVVRS